MSEPLLAVVTGTSRGIGRATALSLSKRGLRLVAITRDAEDRSGLREACRAVGAPSVDIVPLDLNDLDSVERVGADVAGRFGAPAVVIHNAGEVVRARVDELSRAEWMRQLNVNLSAPFVLTRALLPHMLEKRRGRIVFVASISSSIGTPRHSAYCASKWGIVGFMKSLAAELTDSGLMTAAVLPGSVDTRMLEGSGFPPRMSAEDVAHTLTHFALDAPLAHNGAVIEMFGV
ncbi:MAG TPA: SDR family oxidoreductase [Polyangiaceae bacterium]|nr:SDR family oxidoreductase [Polyangiaceae bacterium]